ncbi:YtxH domain-containing protein [Lactobacillus curvatus]|nr:YtxH domain-containing protein [Latilactobacillus curvatus]MSE24512.1 YtxH domain-containing protein [Latilactobacillus curvatus]
MAKKGHFLLGVLVGGAAAIGATLMLTPKTGKELQSKLVDLGDDLMDRAQDYYYLASETAADLKDDAKRHMNRVHDYASDWQDNASDIKEQAKAQFDEKTADLKSQFGDSLEVGQEDFDDIVIDGKSAFGQAKDEAVTAASETVQKVTTEDE